MVPEAKNIIFLGAGFTSGNYGVNALASGAITSFWRIFPGAKIKFLDYNKEPEKYEIKHGPEKGIVKLLNLRFSKKFWMPNNIARLLFTAILVRVIPNQSLQNRIYWRNNWLRQIISADVIGSIAGGDSFSDIYGFKRLIYVALPQLLVLIVGKPLIILPQTIGPFRTALGRMIARYILKRAEKIYSRDKAGLENISKLIGYKHSGLAFCYDLGFLLEPGIAAEKIPEWIHKTEADSPVVGINVSGLLYVGGYNRKNMFGLKCDYIGLINELAENLVRKHGAHIMLVSHVMEGAEGGESDYSACRDMLKQAPEDLRNHLHIIDEGYDHHELKALIGYCDFFIGSRMHACIAALSQGIPAVGLAYSPKFDGVFASIGLRELVIDLRKFDQNHIIETIDYIYSQQAESREKLRSIIPDVHERAMHFIDGII